MTLTFLKGKIHGARVTAADPEYEGSILVDASLLEMAGILEHELVQVWNRSNANRFETYAIAAPPGTGTVSVNGAAAKLVRPGDFLIVASFCQMPPEEARGHRPRVVLVDERNRGRPKE